MKIKWCWFTLTIIHIECLLVLGKGDHNNAHLPEACRNARTWPFLSTSIWNTPIGSGAVFHDPGIFRPPFALPNNFYSDDEYFIVTTSNDPLTPWYNQGLWGKFDPEVYCNITGKFVANIHFPFNLTATRFRNNNVAAILQPDNQTIVNTHPLYRCTPGSPILSLLEKGVEGKDNIVLGNGTWGAYGGSGLSCIGGTIRLGELLSNSSPIRHALKMQLNATAYYYDQPPGYVWPALRRDGYAFNSSSPHHYGGHDIYLSPGSLLAIPSNVTVNVTTTPAKKLLFALQNYGAYIVADTVANHGTLNTEHGVTDEFQAAYGYDFDSGPTGPGAEWYADMLALFQALHVVINNSESTVGGGGTPLQPPPPPICPI